MRKSNILISISVILLLFLMVLVLAASPTQTEPILTASNIQNNTNATLIVYNQSTSDSDGDSVKNIYDWRIGAANTSIAMVNMPFEGGSNLTYTKDYSSRSNNGVVTGAIWNSSGGYDGRGSYYFNGSSTTYIALPDNILDSQDHGTIMFWVEGGGGEIFSYGDVGATTNYALFRSNAAFLYQLREPDGDLLTVELAYPYRTGLSNWTHIAVTSDGTTIRMYVNGTEIPTNVTVSGSLTGGEWFSDIAATAERSCIGVLCRSTISSKHTGGIDDLIIFNRTLSYEEINSIYNNQTNKIVNNETSNGDIWSACVTPNDKTSDGNTLCSNHITITNFPDYDFSINQTINFNPSSIQQGQIVEINTTIYNLVAINISNINVSVYIDSILINSTLVPTLLASGSENISFSWNGTPSNRTILISADPEGTITELNETNNNVTGYLLVNKLVALNFTSPIDNVEIPKGGSTTYEDPESFVSDTTLINVTLYNIYNLTEGINGTCTFYMNGTIIGTNYTFPDGNCMYTFDQTGLGLTDHTLFVNFSNLSTGFVSHTSLINATHNFSIAKYESSNNEINTRSPGYYANGDAAVLTLNITKNGAFYDPANLTVYTRKSSPNTIIQIHKYPGDIIRTSTGNYTVVQVVNSSFVNTAIHWEVYAQDNQTINGIKQATNIPITSGSHADINILAENATINFTFINESNTPIPTTTLVLNDNAGYQLESTSITTSFARPSTFPEDYDITLTTPNASITIIDANFTQNTTISPQLVLNYSGDATGVSNLTSVIALDDSGFNFTNATVVIPTNGISVGLIYHCNSWSFTDANCSSWSSSPTSSYADYTSNATHISFTVTSFSAYAGGEMGDNANLSINNDGPKFTNQNITFNATFYNTTSNAFISSANCIISFNDTNTNFTMSEYLDRYEYNHSFSSAATYAYTITCLANGYTNLSATDNVTVNAYTPPGITTIQNNNTTPATTISIFLNWTLSDNTNLSATWIQISNSSGTSNSTPQSITGIAGIGNYTYVVNDPKATNVSFLAFVNDTDNSLNVSASSSIIVQNTAPNTPSINAPANNTNYSIGVVTLNWTNATDTDSDSLTYILEISNISDFSSIEYANTSITETTTPTGITTPTLPNGTHYWRVRANDGTSNSSVSTSRIFNTTTIPFALTINNPTTITPVQKLQTTLNISLSQTGMIWYNINSASNNTLCSSCTQNTTQLNFSSYGNYTLNIFANNTLGQTDNISLVFSLLLDSDGNGIADSNIDIDDDDGDGITNANDTLKGNASNLNTNFVVSITINGSSNLSQQFSGLLTINITNGTQPFTTFNYNFSSNQTLHLGNISITQQNSSQTQGSILVYGLNLTSNQTKTLYLADINTDKTGICIKDSEVTSIDNISTNCTGNGETKLTCSSSGTTTGNYTCTDEGSWYKITGSSNTLATETSITTSGSSNSGGGGGGNSVGSRIFFSSIEYNAISSVSLKDLDSINYKIIITNTGTKTISNFTITPKNIPESLSVTSISLPITKLLPGETGIIIYIIKPQHITQNVTQITFEITGEDSGTFIKNIPLNIITLKSELPTPNKENETIEIPAPEIIEEKPMENPSKKYIYLAEAIIVGLLFVITLIVTYKKFSSQHHKK